VESHRSNLSCDLKDKYELEERVRKELGLHGKEREDAKRH
jgi:hypothetical protein